MSLIGVRYSYRKSLDLYVLWRGWAHCCQVGCFSTFPAQELIAHVRWHDRRLKCKK